VGRKKIPLDEGSLNGEYKKKGDQKGSRFQLFFHRKNKWCEPSVSNSECRPLAERGGLGEKMSQKDSKEERKGEHQGDVEHWERPRRADLKDKEKSTGYFDVVTGTVQSRYGIRRR